MLDKPSRMYLHVSTNSPVSHEKVRTCGRSTLAYITLPEALHCVRPLNVSRAAANQEENVSLEMSIAIQRWEDEGGRTGSPLLLANSIDNAGHRDDFTTPQDEPSEPKP